MNLTSPSQVRLLLGELGVRPNKRLGQNFLIDRNILDILLRAGGLSAGDRVLEIGPGLGVVTERLLQAGCGVIAVEKDRRLYEFLAQRFEGDAAFELIHADFLDLDIGAVLASGITRVVSNLPYSAGSRMLVELVQSNVPTRMVVTVQQEVAQRMTASPGSSSYGLLSVRVQQAYAPRVVRPIPPTCFWPSPEVSSAIVSLARLDGPRLPPEEQALLDALTRYAFEQRRKQLAGILGHAPEPLHCTADDTRRLLLDMGVPEQARPEDLGVGHWQCLAKALTQHV